MNYEIIIDALEEKIRSLSCQLANHRADTKALDWIVGVIHDYKNTEVIQGHISESLTREYLNRDGGFCKDTHLAIMSAFERRSKDLARQIEEDAQAPF